MHTIAEVSSASPWNGKHGQMFEIKLTLNDGQTGFVNAKTPDRWKVGDEVIITDARTTTHGTKWRLDKAEFQGGGSNPVSPKKDERGSKIDASWAFTKVIEAHGKKALDDEGRFVATAVKFIQLRDQIVVAMSANEPVLSASNDAAAPEPQSNQENGGNAGDLPF